MVMKPKGIALKPGELRDPVVKEVGVTQTERHLAELAERSFLNLWSYPSPYRDQRTGGASKGDGKEICDLLVVCGEHIIIFSEKHIAWPNGDLPTAWTRWVMRSVRAAEKQARGAERWLRDFPDRVFLDRGCKTPFPIEIPTSEETKVHFVVVAGGALEACKAHIPGHSGSLMIEPGLTGRMNWPSKKEEVKPFRIGDINPSGSFIHVLDDVTLRVVLNELDTIADFTEYLQKKEEFVRSGGLAEACGEDNLLAYYYTQLNDDGEHDFVLGPGETSISVGQDRYRDWVTDPQYAAKKEAEKPSKFWDHLVTQFTTHMLDGTSITLDNEEFDLRRNELGIRYMAHENRFMRRLLGQAMLKALEEGAGKYRHFRMMIRPKGVLNSETAYFIMTFKYQDWIEDEGGYEVYREMRTRQALVYAESVLEQHAHLERVIGVAMEPPGQGRGASEDLVYAEQCEWTDEQRILIRKNCEALDIFQRPSRTHFVSALEYPEVSD